MDEITKAESRKKYSHVHCAISYFGLSC